MFRRDHAEALESRTDDVRGFGEGASLTSRAYVLLRRDILQGELVPGLKLKLDDLRQRYDFGASPLREALSLLTSDRLVERVDQKGFRVAAVGVEPFAELLKTRCWLEDRALRESIENGGSDWEEAIVLAAHRLLRVSRWSDERELVTNPEWEHTHKKFHLSLIGACGSNLMIGFCQQMYDQNVRYRQLSGINSYPSRNVDFEHSEIRDAVLDRNAHLATELLVKHYTRTGAYLMSEMFK